LFISFAGPVPPYVVVGAALAVVVVAYEAPAVVAGVAEAFAVVGLGALAVVAAGGVLDRSVVVVVAVAVAEPAPASVAVAVYVTVQLVLVDAVVAGADSAQPVLAGGAFDRLAVAVAPVYVTVQLALVDGAFAQPVPVVSASVQSVVFRVSVAQAASDVQTVADRPDRFASDAQPVGVQSVSGGLPVARLTA